MTLHAVLTESARLGILLTAHGDRLTYSAPKGALTTELRDELVRLKPVLLDLLAPPRAFVTLRGGLILPIEAIGHALDLECRGFTMRLDSDQQVQIEPATALTDGDRAAMYRWRRHLAAIIGCDADAHGGPQ